MAVRKCAKYYHNINIDFHAELIYASIVWFHLKSGIDLCREIDNGDINERAVANEMPSCDLFILLHAKVVTRHVFHDVPEAFDDLSEPHVMAERDSVAAGVAYRAWWLILKLITKRRHQYLVFPNAL